MSKPTGPPSDSIDFSAQGNFSISGDLVGRDKIVNNIQNIVQRALTAAEAAHRARELEQQVLAQGVSAYAQNLQRHASRGKNFGQGNPYKELSEYDLGDVEIFFGRKQAIADLLQRLGRGRLSILHAESGAGKTSLLQAGLMPRLIASGHLPLYLRPYDVDPALKIKNAFIAELNYTPELAETSLRGYLKSVGDVLGPDATLYIFLDQFEEFFTQLDQATRAGFVRSLAECLDDKSLGVRWVLALRAEFFSELDSLRPRVRNPFENEYRLNRLTRAEAQEAIAQPSLQCGLQFEAGLTETLLNDLSQGADAVQPPHMQLVCSALYEALKPGEKVMTRALYQAEGRMAGILGEYLGRVLRRIHAPEARALAPRLLEALITSDNRRARRTRAELAAELALGQSRATEAATLDGLLSQLVNSRLLRVDETDLRYELVHDYLLGQITLDPAVQARKAAQELLDGEARNYALHQTLLSDDKLAIIGPRRSELILTDTSRELIERSAHALRRRQRFVWGGIGLVIVLVIVGALSLISALAANQQRQAAIGTQRAAETQATSAAALQLTSEFRAAGASTQEAIARAGQATSEAGAARANTQSAFASTQAALARDTIRKTFENTRLVTVGNRPSALAYDGTRLWVANKGSGTVQAIDPATGDPGAPIPVGTNPSVLAYDGTRLWVANASDGTVQAIDPATGDVGAPIPVGNYPSALVYDGTRLWVANQEDDTVQYVLLYKQ